MFAKLIESLIYYWHFISTKQTHSNTVMRVLFACLIITFTLGVAFTDSIILKTQDFNITGFDSVPAGLTYPEYIYPRTQLNWMQFDVYNLTSERIQFSAGNFSRGGFSSCESAMEKIDYGYYTKFPFYRIIVECSNQTHTQVFNVKIYRSLDSEVKPGPITSKSPEELNCNAGPLRVQYFYSASGSASTFVYRFCAKKNSTTQSLYKEYIMDSPSAYVFKEDSVERVTGLTNISLIDMQPTIGVDGKFNVFLSENYGVIVNGGSKFLQTVWAIPNKEKPLKIEKMCWGNNFAVLTDGYIYFIAINIYSNQTVGVSLLRKTDRIDANCSQCNLITIGRFAVCSIYNVQNVSTTWHIFGVDTKLIKTNVTEVWAGKNAKPYVSESSCATNSFYEGHSRYQFYFGSLAREETSVSNKNFALRYRSLEGANGRPVSFLDTGLLFVVNTFPSGSSQYFQFYGYSKPNFDSTALFAEQMPFSKNVSLPPQIEYEPVTSNSSQAYLTVIVNDRNTINTSYFVRYSTTPVSPYYRKEVSYSINVKLSNIAYLKNFQVSGDYFAAVKSTIENNAVGLISANSGNLDLRYAYSFEVDSFTACSLTTADNQLLYFRQDSNGLVVMKASFCNKNSLVQDSIIVLTQYSGMTAKCAHDGLLLLSPSASRIILLDSQLVVKKSLSATFSDMKFTRTLALLKNGQFVEIRTLSHGDLIGLYKWDLDDIITNIHSDGFIYAGQPPTYYQFANNLDMRQVDDAFADAHKSHLQEERLQ